MKDKMKWVVFKALLFVGALLISVSADCAVSNYAEVLLSSQKFIASLDAKQRSMALVEYSRENAVKWTNLPCGLQCRVGILLGTLSPSQLVLAKSVAKAALGSSPGSGYDQVLGIMDADAFLGKNRKEYSSENYIIAFLGRPDKIGKWQLQIGGHHLAVNLTFDEGKVVSASPLFMGLEPPENQTLKGNHDALVNLLKSMDASQLSKAKLLNGYPDVLVGPGKDGSFPSTKAGIKGADLSVDQRRLMLMAIQQWVHIADEKFANQLMKIYAAEIKETYVAFYGSKDLTNRMDYVRIDGPGIWIEFICQPGAVFPQGIHYHTIYRDHTRDYGGSFQF